MTAALWLYAHEELFRKGFALILTAGSHTERSGNSDGDNRVCAHTVIIGSDCSAFKKEMPAGKVGCHYREPYILILLQNRKKKHCSVSSRADLI